MALRYQRILLKISGEALGGDAEFGFDAARCAEIAGEVVALAQSGVQLGIVVGGGNFFRGVRDADLGLQRATVDAMGMLATGINALAFADLLRSRGLAAEVMSAVPAEPLLPRFERSRAVAALEAGRAAVFAAGTGNPYFSTDTAAALRAVEIGADLVAKATKVDGIYDKDPKAHADARRYEKISYAEVLAKGLGVMDAAAAALCRDNRMPVLVFDLSAPGSIRGLGEGKTVGTLMS